ncbi:protein-disulfide isomerase [Archangium gephyra]|uniref:Periplasmic thiol:disulfide interchange protein DsbA n=1 Tax=Archangium gephyra TaxID=48 RepID=A0AAC8TA00_9BACT|nr:thioredoxin domain-containing protein [Archangium gephyra]AKI98454.1 Periplasmic thiol:disulfide interchange protein DsbA [Archangium gephyra]REG20446.1 protein-disulfide isomerase [Archangium gephyra]
MKRMLTAALVGAFVSGFVPVSSAEACDGSCPKGHVPQAAEPRAATPRREAPGQGPADAKVTVEVWSDFQCPFCAKGGATLKQLREKYGDRIRIVFRHMPLPFHENARLAAAASMAAAEQGRFWEFHDALFQQQTELDRKSLEKLAKKLKLDVERFQRALDSGAYDNYLEAEVTEARQRGVSGTPTFFINDTALVGARPVEQFIEAIDAELKG